MKSLKQALPEERRKRSTIDLIADIGWGKRRIKELEKEHEKELEYLRDRVHGDMMELEMRKMKAQAEESFRLNNIKKEI